MITYTIKVIDPDKAISRPSGYIDEYTIRVEDIDDLRRKVIARHFLEGHRILAVYRGTKADDFTVPDVGFLDIEPNLGSYRKHRILWKPTSGSSRKKEYPIDPHTGRTIPRRNHRWRVP